MSKTRNKFSPEHRERAVRTDCGACLIVAALAVLWVREGRVSATGSEIADHA